MSELQIVTFADKALTENNYLKKTCDEKGLKLVTLISSPWIQNVIKLKLLADFVKFQDPELILLMVDAYDVLIYGDAKEIISKFHESKTDILFSGESNFMYKEPAKWLSFLKKYPPQDTIYQYLNSGSYIGKAKHIKQLLDSIQGWFEIDFNDTKKLLSLKSDQYLLHRFYVENYYTSESSLVLDIDDSQRLLGCTGGRFCVIKFPDLGKWQAFSFFILERNILKLFALHKYQKRSKDFALRGKQFLNRKTNQLSTVMHFPGTWDRFDKVLVELSAKNQKRHFSLGWLVAAVISLASFLLSMVIAPLFWLITKK